MKPRITTRMLLAILALVMMLGCFAGCSDKGNGETVTTAGPEDTTPPTLNYELPVADFEEETITVLCSYNKCWQFDCEWWYNPDTLNYGLYQRDKKMEEVLNCKIEYIFQTNQGSGDAETFSTVLQEDQLAQSGLYDVVYHEPRFGLDFQGFFYNLYDPELSTVVNLDQPFYFDDWNNVATISGALVSAMGYGSVEMMATATVTIFNHAWWKQLFEGNIYDYVYDGDWTIELMKNMAKEANVDISQNGMNLEEGDRFGLGYMAQAQGMFYTMGGKFVTKNTDGNLTYSLVNDKNIAVYEALYDLFHDDPAVYLQTTNEASPAYHAEQVLFLLSYFDAAKVIRKDGDTEFGFLPNPKLQSTDSYQSTIIGGGMFSIPKTVDDKMKSGIFMNAFNYYSYEKVRPAYFEALSVRLSKDPDSLYVVNTCLNNLVIDFAKIYNNSLSACGSAYWPLIVSNKEDQFVSTYLKLEEAFDTAFNTLIADFIANTQS